MPMTRAASQSGATVAGPVVRPQRAVTSHAAGMRHHRRSPIAAPSTPQLLPPEAAARHKGAPSKGSIVAL